MGAQKFVDSGYAKASLQMEAALRLSQGLRRLSLAPSPQSTSIFFPTRNPLPQPTPNHNTYPTAAMPQNEYMERFAKQHGKRLDHDERKRKRQAREGHAGSEKAQNYRGLRAKLYQEKRRKEKIQMKKQIRAHEERNVKSSEAAEPSNTPLPAYLLDRSNEQNAKALSSAIKNKRAEKAAKFSVPLPKVRGIAEEEMFKVVKTGKKTAKKSWKRMITKPTFVGPDFTRRPVKYERFVLGLLNYSC